MHFLINELSFTGQAINNYESTDKLMKNIYEIIQEIMVIQNGHPIQTHSSFAAQKLSPELTVKGWIYSRINSDQSDNKKIASLLVRLLTKGPFVDTQELLTNCKCYYNGQDISSSSLAGAAKLMGILISLRDNPNFTAENIEVEFDEGRNTFEKINLTNLTESKQARKICPRYKPHSKHDIKGYWKNATPMDLKDEEAQKVLNCSICNTNENSEKRYGYSKRTGKFYVFHFDNTFDVHGHPTYHGFPIPENEVPAQIFSQIKS